MGSIVRRVVNALQRFPRVSVLAVSILIFGGARHYVNARIQASMNETDQSLEAEGGCSSNASCRPQ